jgi:glycine dehydrogenase subunit 1
MNLDVVAVEPKVDGSEDLGAEIDKATACVIIQCPDFFGNVKSYHALADACHAAGALLVVVVNEIVSLGALAAPGDLGADIVACEGQSLGNPMSFGGPHVGLFAVAEKYVRQMPGRLAGETVDVDGRRGWVLTLSTREQHIRREKATSNICTNSGLCALAFSIHLTLLGGAGFANLAALNHARAMTLADKLARVQGVEVVNRTFFNEFTVKLSKPAGDVVDGLAENKILAGVPVSRLYPGRGEFENLLLVAATETTSDADMDALVNALVNALADDL